MGFTTNDTTDTHKCTWTHTPICKTLPTTKRVLCRRRVKPECQWMSAKLTGWEKNPEGDLTQFDLGVTGPSGYDLSIPWFHPIRPPGHPVHGRLHWVLSKSEGPRGEHYSAGSETPRWPGKAPSEHFGEQVMFTLAQIWSDILHSNIELSDQKQMLNLLKSQIK